MAYQIDVYPASQLGKETDINQGLTLGTVDMIISGPSFAARTYPRFGIAYYPFIFRDGDHLVAQLRRAGLGAAPFGFERGRAHLQPVDVLGKLRGRLRSRLLALGERGDLPGQGLCICLDFAQRIVHFALLVLGGEKARFERVIFLFCLVDGGVQAL